jgi:hypothetical protein
MEGLRNRASEDTRHRERQHASPGALPVSRPVMTTPLLSAVLVLALTLTALGQGDPSAGATLRGLVGVNVVIEELPMELEAEPTGLTRATLKADAEAQLREAGIRVLNDTEWQTAPGQPWLFVRVKTMRPTSTMPVYVYVISVDLMQRTMLVRDPNIHAVGMTWTTGEIGTVVGNNLSRVRDHVRSQVDSFISAYRAVNQRP